MNPKRTTYRTPTATAHWQRAAGTLAACLGTCLCLAVSSLDSNAAATAPEGAVYPAPTGGWTYIFNGDKDTYAPDGSGFASLDGTWSRENDSCVWDGSKLGGTLTMDGSNSPGGIMSVTEDGVTYLRMQDPGDPRIAGFPDTCNRKLYLGHNITEDGGSDKLIDDGVTLTFRARIPTPKNTKAPIDQRYPSGGTGPVPYPDTGDGNLISGGKGNFGIKQSGLGIISFGLCVPTDKIDDSDANSPLANFAGLNMNKLNGTNVTAAVDFDSPAPAEFRGIALDPTQWHEFWIAIKADTTGVGTHQLSVYMDGSTTPTNLIVTASDGDDYLGLSYLGIGASRTSESYALDIDFFAYKLGAEAPTGGGVSKPQISSIVLNSSARKAVITWTGGGVLQSETSFSGPWTEVTGAGSSPATVSLTDPARFYRVKK